MSSALESPARPGWGESLYGALFAPQASFTERPPRLRPALALSAVLAGVATFTIGFTGLFGLWLGFAALWGALLLGWALVGGAATLIARAVASRGEVRPMLAGLGYAAAPFLCAAPLSVLAGWGTPAAVLAAIATAGLWAWSVRVAAAALQAQTGLSLPRAVLTVIGAFLLVAALPGALFTLAALGAIAAFV